MIGYVSRAFFHTLARSRPLQQLASRYGMRSPSSFARRFIAGETVDEAIEAARTIEANGMTQTLDLLGESVATMAEADAATRTYLTMFERIVAAGIGRNVSLKLTQLGLTIDRATCVDNLRRILDVAAANDFFVRVDMESSEYTQVTLDIFETVWQQGYRDAGIVLQAYLKRSAGDVARMNAIGARVRLVKGAYQEPKALAFQRKADVDVSFVQLTEMLLEHGTYPAIATHDPDMIDATRRFASTKSIPPERYEFQMLYGIRRDLQRSLRDAGHRVRVYVPFGREWFPYFMRRLGERPANIGFVINGLLREERTHIAAT
jgi:proline dehydrogenase